MEYTAGELVRLAKRDGNTRRPYLFVNPLQGKHIPADPEAAERMCRAAAERLNRAWPEDRLYVIGFAETATGIAASICSHLNHAVYYQHTTRENSGEDVIHFSEAHSHATDQMLCTAGIGEALARTDRIVFIDDEVTTGKTICGLIDRLSERFDTAHLHYTVLSLLNSMSDERVRELRSRGIDCLCLCRIPYEYEKDSILDVTGDPDLHIRISPRETEGALKAELICRCPVHPSRVVRFQAYERAAAEFAEEIRRRLLDGTEPVDRVLVLGTEEFMYPTFTVGSMIRRLGYGKTVRIHATSRSPILASRRDGYPLTVRYQMRSPYDPERCVYVYNLERYDRVILLTDAAEPAGGIADLTEALRQAGNREIALVRWRTDGKETP